MELLRVQPTPVVPAARPLRGGYDQWHENGIGVDEFQRLSDLREEIDIGF
jgi:hypothetical protein